MKNKFSNAAIGLAFGMMLGVCPAVSAQENTGTQIHLGQLLSQRLPAEEQTNTKVKATEKFRLYYLRSASTITTILQAIVKGNANFEGTVIQSSGNNEILVYGTKQQRKNIERIVAVLDLPREGVELDMWGILISSSSPEHLADVMKRVNAAINETRLLIHQTYKELADFAREIPIADDFQRQLEQDYKFEEALSSDKYPLSMIDILLRVNGARDPETNYISTIKNLCELFQNDRYKYYTNYLRKQGKRPFGTYFWTLGLQNNTKHLKASKESCVIDIDDLDKDLVEDNKRRQKIIFKLCKKL